MKIIHATVLVLMVSFPVLYADVPAVISSSGAVQVMVEQVPAQEVAAAGLSRQLAVLFTNSTNGALESCGCKSNPNGGLDRAATYIALIRKKYQQCLVFDSGDMLPPYAPAAFVDAVTQVYKRIRYDAVIAGDQDLLHPSFQQKVARSGIPFLPSNIAPRAKKNAPAHVSARYYKKCGVRIAVIALNGADTFDYYPVPMVEKLHITPADAYLEEFFKRRKNYDFLILLSHGGLDFDKRIAHDYPGINLIISGHNPVHMPVPLRIGKTIIVQSGRGAREVGKLILSFDPEKNVSIADYDLRPLTEDIVVDNAVKEIIKKYKKTSQKRSL
ncbi:MAG: hypothetical protein A2219_04295 [Elusimicrobia bacterium RIFOXYA2_FULL_50_26]|nr:MAG: hypothetical protein A2219_04295 [Elusimicrobia bacterium RIFOXYA2_FULL_50_26]OGS24972.1 MAG: hypothetical protein A2314_00185 [Elusimicrobia bacterium RIFOXYB2_FULL_50_12]